MTIQTKRLFLTTILAAGAALGAACEGGGFFVDGRFQDAMADGAELAVPESPIDAAPEPAADAQPPEEIQSQLKPVQNIMKITVSLIPT